MSIFSSFKKLQNINFRYAGSKHHKTYTWASLFLKKKNVALKLFGQK